MRHILSKAYNDKSIACNVKYIGQSTAFNVTLMMETSPHTMQKALHLMQNAPHIIKNAPHIIKNAPHIIKNAPHIMMGNHLQALTGLNFFFRPHNIHEKITQF